MPSSFEQPESFEARKEAFLEQLKVKEQWESQIRVLNQSGVLEILPEVNDLGIVGIDGHEYPVPTYEQIKDSLTPEKLARLEQKAEQGFTQLMLVPMAMPLDILIDRYKRVILKHHQAGTMLSPDGTKLEVDEKNPVDVWGEIKGADAEDRLVYYPKQFSEDHQGKTKKELIQENGAWETRFIEDLPNLPAKGQGKTIGGRKQLEADQTPIQYLKTIQTDPAYQHEQGVTPELWLTKAITHSETTNQQIDDYQGPGKVSFLFGSYLPSTDDVPYAAWHRGNRRAYLYGVYPGYHNSGNAAFAAGENSILES